MKAFLTGRLFYLMYFFRQSDLGSSLFQQSDLKYENPNKTVLLYLRRDNLYPMRYFFIFLFFAFSISFGFAQNNQLWKGYFSYNDVRDVTQSPTRFFAACENALFSKSVTSNELKTTNTIDGLPSQEISATYHSTTFNKTLVGYGNGLIIVVNENDGSILNVVDIINKQIPPNIKKVNHFNEQDGIVYVSCDFGIVQYNLATLQFGDTYFIGNFMPEIVVTQTAVFNGYIYAATRTEGIRRAEITNPNLIDATQWVQVATGSFSGIEAFGGSLFAASTSGQISHSTNGIGFTGFGPALSPASLDIRGTSQHLIITTPASVFVYDTDFTLIRRVDAVQIPEITAVFSCATVLSNTIYIGTKENGVITTSIINQPAFEFISPNGPTRNNMFSVNATTANLWVTYAVKAEDANPYPLQYLGISKYVPATGWLNIRNQDLNSIPNLTWITINPANENQVFVSSNIGGLLKLENDELVTVYDHTNTGNNGLESLFPPATDIRLDQSAYDNNGNLWMPNGLVKKALKVFRAGGSWQSYALDNVLKDYFDSRFGRLVVDKNNTKWMSSRSDGVVAFNEAYNNGVGKTIKTGDTEGNLPSNAVMVTAIDKRNQLWIGTQSGLRVLSSVDSFLNDDQMDTFAIIIEEGNIGEELLNDQWITDIVVDGANNKWVGTLNSGVFHFSSNGQETLHHFTSANSPLPSNQIADIDINSATGEVFFATPGGLVSFKGDAIDASENLSNVRVYPNPVRPEFSGTVKITGLTDKANIKITDIEGNLVYETISEGGTIEWDTRAFGKYRVASGVYMIFIAGEDGMETKVKKVMIIR